MRKKLVWVAPSGILRRFIYRVGNRSAPMLCKGGRMLNAKILWVGHADRHGLEKFYLYIYEDAAKQVRLDHFYSGKTPSEEDALKNFRIEEERDTLLWDEQILTLLEQYAEKIPKKYLELLQQSLALRSL